MTTPSEPVPMLTQKAAQYYADLNDPKVSMEDFCRNGYSGDGSPDEVAAFRAIASGRVVCVEAERLAELQKRAAAIESAARTARDWMEAYSRVVTPINDAAFSTAMAIILTKELDEALK